MVETLDMEPSRSRPAPGSDPEPDDRRQSPRSAFSGRVTVRFGADALAGPGQNISREGVCFVADGVVRVLVEVEGRPEPVVGELVRVQTTGDGRTNLAIRFVDPGA
ncbi:MAG: PilZ domain-containing protein [Planctomycetes bacterium]|nr:PilZ domain-containing protein [Planctomycetota bacterium]